MPRFGWIALLVVMLSLPSIFLPLDRAIAERLQDSATQANRFLGKAATDFERATVPGTYIIGGALYAVGRIAVTGRQ